MLLPGLTIDGIDDTLVQKSKPWPPEKRYRDSIYSSRRPIVYTSLGEVTDEVTEMVTETELKLLSLLLKDPACTYSVIYTHDRKLLPTEIV